MANKRKEEKEKRGEIISVAVTKNLRDDVERLAKALGFSRNDFCCKVLSLAVAKNYSSIQELENAQMALDKVQADFLLKRENAIEKFEKTFAADDGLKGANGDD